MPVTVSKKWLLAFAIFSFVACNVVFFTPGKDLPEMGDWFGEFSMDKLIHTALFCGTCFLFLSYSILFYKDADSRRLIWIITILFLIWAILTELIQLFLIEGRNGSVLDSLADAAGVLIALILVRLGLVRKLFAIKDKIN